MVAASIVGRHSQMLEQVFGIPFGSRLEDFKIRDDGKYELNVFVQGMPTKMWIDDTLPFKKVDHLFIPMFS